MYRLIKFNMSIKIFFLMKYCMFLFFFCSDGVTPNYLWYVKHWKNKPGQKRGTDVFHVQFKKTKTQNIPGHHPLPQETALWAVYLTPSGAVWDLRGSVGAAEPGKERAGLIGTCYWSSHAMLADRQQILSYHSC